jgi:DNA-binding XRE family transcriptional regulator
VSELRELVAAGDYELASRTAKPIARSLVGDSSAGEGRDRPYFDVPDRQQRSPHPVPGGVTQQVGPGPFGLPEPVGQGDQLLGPVGADPDQHQQAQRMAELEDIIAANVRGNRARLKLTQRQLGERLGIAGDTVSDIETGRRTITANDLPRLYAALDITLVELLQRADPADLRALGLD